MRSLLLVTMLVLAGSALVGCVQVKAPETIQIGSGPPPEDIDSAQVPPTTTHEQARAELTRAYRQIRWLESENERLRERGDRYKRKYKDLKDKYDD